MLRSLLTINKSEHKSLFRLALPMMMSELIFSLDMFFNNLFAARLGHEELAAQALLSLLFFTFSAGTWGFFSGFGVLMAREHGANKPKNVAQILQQGICLSFIISFVISVIIWHAPTIFTMLGQDPKIAVLSRGYAHALAVGTWGLNLYSVIAEFLIGTSRTKIIFWLSIVETILNITLKYGLVFGKFGLPNIGLAGLGWAISIVIWLTLAIMLAYLVFAKTNAPYRLWQWQKQQWHFLIDATQVGWPTGLLLAEEIAFLFVFSFFMGKISVSTLAANQIALQFVGFFGTMIWGLGQATTARVGNKLGERSEKHARLSGITGVQLSLCLTVVIALVFLAFPHTIIAIDFKQPHSQLSNEAAMFLRISAFYLILNATRILANCGLRAYKDTRYPLLVSAGILWIIAVPLGYLMTFHSSLGPSGFWLAAIIAELIGTVLLLKRLIGKQSHEPLFTRH
jgi:multidrug resistance protein, MATE family